MANKAGNKRASKISAVITLCLSMVSSEKQAAKGAACQAVEATAWDSNSNGHDLLFFGSHQLVNFRHALVGQLLNIGFGALLIVFRSLLFLDQLFDRFIGITAQLTESNFGIFPLGLG